MVNLIVPIEDGGSLQLFEMPVSTALIVIIGLISVAIPITFYLLRSFALYKMAKTENMAKAYLCFIPFLWTYIAGKIAGTPVYFGKPIKKFALLFCIFFTISELTTLIYELLIYLPVFGYMLQGGELLYVTEVSSSVANVLSGSYHYYLLAPNFFVPNENFINVSYATYAFLNVIDVISLALIPVDLIAVVFSITMYSGVFKKYWPLHYFSGIIFSIFGLFPIFAFVVRKNKPVDFNRFMRERFARYNAYNPYQNPYQNPYNNPYNNVNPNQAPNSENPFSEFKEKKDTTEDPFNEFNNDKEEK